MKSLGIIGGLGPMATVYLLELITDMTDAATDQQHINSIIYNFPVIPDRTAHILDNSKPSPLPAMVEIAQKLDGMGVSVIATPCNTAHYFYDDLAKSVSVPIINVLSETTKILKEEGAKKVGIMATTGTISTRLFQNEFEKAGIDYALPDEDGQAKVMSVIYNDIKAGKEPNMGEFYQVAQNLRDNGCDCIILGCTELSLVKRSHNLGPGFLDTLEVISKRCIEMCDKSVKPQYSKLITG
ncbi:MAG: amino acid racemase [Clostridia bacterium]|nr:amino acid racemase [Clostridia bacterium]